MTSYPTTMNAPDVVPAGATAGVEGEEPTTHMRSENLMTNDTAITPNLTDTSWLGAHLDSMDAATVAKLCAERADALEVFQGDAEIATQWVVQEYERECAHAELQERMAHVPTPAWADSDLDDWEQWNDGVVRRGHTLLRSETLDATLGSNDPRAAVDCYAGAYEVANAPTEVYVSVCAESVYLTASETRRYAAAILRAADRVDEVTAQIEAGK